MALLPSTVFGSACEGKRHRSTAALLTWNIATFLLLLGFTGSAQAQFWRSTHTHSGYGNRSLCATSCGHASTPCSPCYAARSVDLLTRVFCPMYPTEPSGSGFLYYALECDRDANGNCTTLNPTAVYGNYNAPIACPYCIPGFCPVVMASRSGTPPGLDVFPGYEKPIRPDSYDPTDPNGGLPQWPTWERPTIVDVKPVTFSGIYAKVFTLCIQPRAACMKQGFPHCDKLPEYSFIKLGFQVAPSDPNAPGYTPVTAEKIGPKVVRAYTGLPGNKQESAIVVLVED